MKNLSVFIFQQSWFQLGSLLESIKIKEKDFYKIDFYFVSKNLLVKPLNPHQDFKFSKYIRISPESYVASYLKEFFAGKKIIFNFTYSKLPKKSQSFDCEIDQSNMQCLQRTVWQNTALGMAISSFIISLTKDSDPRLKKYRNLIDNLALTYFQIFSYLVSLKLDKKQDEIWVWNGRTFHERVIVEYANKKDIPIKFIEIGGEGFDQSRWILHDKSPHHRIDHQKSIKDHFKEVAPNLIEIKQWFLSKYPGGTNRHSSRFQIKGDENLFKKYYVYFSSSDDEVSSISNDWNSIWGTQLKAVEALMKYFKERPELNLVIRVHPNQKNKSRNDKGKWMNLKSPSTNIRIFDYNSKVNSYALIAKSEGVFTYGSTIGVEAAHLKKPGALLSYARWDQLVPHPFLKSVNDINNWVCEIESGASTITEQLEVCYQGSLTWGHYMSTAGTYWKALEIRKDFRQVNVGYLNNYCLKPNLLVIGISRIMRFFRLHMIEMRINRKASS